MHLNENLFSLVGSLRMVLSLPIDNAKQHNPVRTQESSTFWNVERHVRVFFNEKTRPRPHENEEDLHT